MKKDFGDLPKLNLTVHCPNKLAGRITKNIFLSRGYVWDLRGYYGHLESNTSSCYPIEIHFRNYYGGCNDHYYMQYIINGRFKKNKMRGAHVDYETFRKYTNYCLMIGRKDGKYILPSHSPSTSNDRLSAV